MPTYKDFTGLYDFSKSLKRAPAPYTTTRLVPIGDLSAQQRPFSVYGDEATVGFISELKIKWGTTEPEAWDNLEDKKFWQWNIRTKWLLVTDSGGNILARRRAPTWSDLLVSWEVLESHQFTYYFDAGFIPNPFLIARRDENMLDAQREHYSYGTVDAYLADRPWGGGGSGGGKGSIFRYIMYVRDVPFSESFLDATKLLEEIHTGLSALVQDLSAMPYFPVEYNLFKSADSLTARWQRPPRDGYLRLSSLILFWANATASLFLGDEHENKPCYEPWMLWEMWKWLQKFRFGDIPDVIFDLSPNWGDT